MKIRCTTCGEEKDPFCFSKQASKKSGYKHNCKDCHNTYVREVWYPKNAEKQKAASRKWKANNPLKVRAAIYGVQPEEVGRLLEEAGGRCIICSEETTLALDHCHATGKLRGFLCKACNMGLGLFKDNPALLSSAIEYLNQRG